MARGLAAAGYEGTVGMEAWASGDDEDALDAFRAAFTLQDTTTFSAEGTP